jgi:hypothetical protein
MTLARRGPRSTLTARVLLSLIVLAFCTAPTPGDVGGCGQRAEELDPELFFNAKAAVDCERCNACTLATRACSLACTGEDLAREFPADCLPLVHDGEVCLHALSAASCDDYERYVRDDAREVPTECNFCPERGR